MNRKKMERRRIIPVILSLAAALGVAVLFALKSDTEPVKGLIVFTRIPAHATGWNPDQAQIAALKPGNKKPEILTEEFYAARSPEASCDGRYIVFSAKKTKSEPWQIWKMNLSGNKIEKVFDCKTDCTDPAFLPDGQIVYSKRIDVAGGVKGFALFTCTGDGAMHKQISFHPHDDMLSTVMQDGRILTLSRQLYPEKRPAQLIALRPNGTKARLFYINPENTEPVSMGRETGHDRMVFVEKAQEKDAKGMLVSIYLHRPLHSRELLSDDADFLSAYPLESGKLLVSCQPAGSGTFGLYEFDPVKKKLGKKIYSDPDHWAVEPVAVYRHPRPKKLPDDLLCSDMTGRILCLDANFSDLPPLSDHESASKGTIIEVMGLEGKWGEVDLENDGSFFLRLTANKPVRFRTVNDAGEVVRGPSAWIWLRPHERRGCVGCHEDRELAPGNKRPDAIANLPFEIMAPKAKVREETNSKTEKTGR